MEFMFGMLAGMALLLVIACIATIGEEDKTNDKRGSH